MFVSGCEPTCFSTCTRTRSRSSPIFCKTLTATPCPSLIRPSKRCSVPTKLWFNRSASLRASAKTCWARGVKSFISAILKPRPLPNLVDRLIQHPPLQHLPPKLEEIEYCYRYRSSFLRGKSYRGARSLLHAERHRSC